MAAREKKQVERGVIVSGNQNLPAHEFETETVELLLIDLQNATEKLARVVPRNLFPRVIAEEFGEGGLLVGIWRVLVNVHFDSHSMLNIDKQIAAGLAVQCFNQR